MEPTISRHLPSPALAAAPSWLAARLAVVALILWAVTDVLRTTFAVGHYEDRIVAVTHGDADVLPAWMAYALLKELTPRGVAAGLADSSWILPSLVAAAAFITWLYQARHNAGRLGGVRGWAAGWWWVSVLVTVLLNGLIWLYHAATSDGGRFEGAALDTRTVAYPLWTAGTVMIVVTSFLSVRMVRRITEAQQRTAEAVREVIEAGP